VRSPGRLFSRQQLLAQVWGPGYERAVGNLRLYMAKLRHKLEPDPARPRWLLTEPGVGYRFELDSPDGRTRGRCRCAHPQWRSSPYRPVTTRVNSPDDADRLGGRHADPVLGTGRHANRRVQEK